TPRQAAAIASLGRRALASPGGSLAPVPANPVPEEEIIVITGTSEAGPIGRRAPATDTAQAPRRLGLVLAVIATAQLMVVLDLTIVIVALPHIQQDLGFSGTNLEWVVNAYAVAFGGLLLLGGRAGDLLERRRVFIAGLIVFSLASLLGGLATSQAWLIAARGVQGAGGASGCAHRTVTDRGHLPGGPAAQPRSRRVLGDGHRRRRGRTRCRGPAGHLRQLAVGAVRERADRTRGRGPGNSRAAQDATERGAVRPAP